MVSRNSSVSPNKSGKNKNAGRGFFVQTKSKKLNQKKPKVFPISNDSTETKSESEDSVSMSQRSEGKFKVAHHHSEQDEKEKELIPQTMMQYLVSLKNKSFRNMSFKDTKESKNRSKANLYASEKESIDEEAKPPVPKESAARRFLRQLSSFGGRTEKIVEEEAAPDPDPPSASVFTEKAVSNEREPAKKVPCGDTNPNSEENVERSSSTDLPLYIEETRDRMKSSHVIIAKGKKELKTDIQLQKEKDIKALVLEQEKQEEQENKTWHD